MIFTVLAVFSAGAVYGRENVAALSAESLRYTQALMAVGICILPPVFFAFLFQDTNVFNALAFNKAPKFTSVLLCVAVMTVSMPLTAFFEEINLAMKLPDFLAPVENWMRSEEENAKIMTEKLLGGQSGTDYFFNVLVVALIPALGEELFFRAGIQKNLLGESAKLKGWICVLIASAVFSAGHLQFFGFLPRFFLGGLLGVMLLFSKSLWLPVICHFFNNFVAVTAYFFKSGDTGLEQSNFAEKPVVVVFSALLTIFLVYLLAKNGKKTAA